MQINYCILKFLNVIEKFSKCKISTSFLSFDDVSGQVHVTTQVL